MTPRRPVLPTRDAPGDAGPGASPAGLSLAPCSVFAALAPLFAFAALGSLAPLGCIARGYPLASSGRVEIRLDVAGALFAADARDASGAPTLPRQRPFETGVTLAMTEESEPAWGGFVHVRVEPPEALVLGGEPGGDPSCEPADGAFRCTASREGIARFVVSSQSDWSGEARLVVTWANQRVVQAIQVLPAGLPTPAQNFRLLLGGLDEGESQAGRVLATYLALSCSIGPLPDDVESKWRKGAIRVREAYVRATPPSSQPGVVENAPVLVESLSSEAALSLGEDCEARETRLRLLLGPTGQSPRFFVCFSDLGGTIDIAASSGAPDNRISRTVVVEPEPRLLRVLALRSEVEAGSAPVNLFEISAFDAERVRIPLPVDLRTTDDDVLPLPFLSVTLAPEESDATLLAVAPGEPGEAKLVVTPRLLESPRCESPAIDVVPPPPPEEPPPEEPPLASPREGRLEAPRGRPVAPPPGAESR